MNGVMTPSSRSRVFIIRSRMVTDLFTTPKCIRKVGRPRGHMKSLKLSKYYLKSDFREQNITDLLRQTNPDSGDEVGRRRMDMVDGLVVRGGFDLKVRDLPVCGSMLVKSGCIRPPILRLRADYLPSCPLNFKITRVQNQRRVTA
ncbi:hypothetical protein TNCV_1313551 [Trichonephila clavipes]|nr:hypothetical protein TNCV_1313551 [Trichonephila clavipes]